MASRATLPTAVASRRLLEALSGQTANQYLEDLVAGCQSAARVAEAIDRPDLAQLWIAFADVALSVAEDHMAPEESRR